MRYIFGITCMIAAIFIEQYRLQLLYLVMIPGFMDGFEYTFKLKK